MKKEMYELIKREMEYCNWSIVGEEDAELSLPHSNLETLLRMAAYIPAFKCGDLYYGDHFVACIGFDPQEWSEKLQKKYRRKAITEIRETIVEYPYRANRIFARLVLKEELQAEWEFKNADTEWLYKLAKEYGIDELDIKMAKKYLVK